jgi:hypothetical protein
MMGVNMQIVVSCSVSLMLIVILLSVILLSVILLSVIMLSVMAPRTEVALNY